jgi:hypothetical protein
MRVALIAMLLLLSAVGPAVAGTCFFTDPNPANWTWVRAKVAHTFVDAGAMVYVHQNARGYLCQPTATHGGYLTVAWLGVLFTLPGYTQIIEWPEDKVHYTVVIEE